MLHYQMINIQFSKYIEEFNITLITLKKMLSTQSKFVILDIKKKHMFYVSYQN